MPVSSTKHKMVYGTVFKCVNVKVFWFCLFVFNNCRILFFFMCAALPADEITSRSLGSCGKEQ